MSFMEDIQHASFNRRAFVAASAAAAALAGLGLTGCENKVRKATKEEKQEIDLEGGTWVPFNCVSTTCASRCYNRAYVVDGVIVRHGTDNTHEDSEDYPQQRCCPRGRSTRTFLTGPDRLKYPMKRVHWEPGGGERSHGDLRGKDEWERISWDEAIELIASELTRIKDAYGNRAFLAMGLMDTRLGAGFLGSATLNMLGGCLTTWGQASVGGFSVTSQMIRGHWSLGASDAQDRMSLRHAKLIVLWALNPAWSISGNDIYNFIVAKRKAGAKVIVVDPYFHPSAQALADEWVPCRPGTDGALLEAIAYEMIEHDWQDQDFLDRCCVGFDAEHMPADAKTDENFKDYILGAYDGVPKTPEWASAICGASPEAIRSLAEQMAKTKPMALKAGQAPARTYYGNRFAQLFFTVGWMTGNVGILGGEVAAGAGLGTSHFGAAGKGMVKLGGTGYQFPANPICAEPRAAGAIAAGKLDPEQEYGLPYSECYKAGGEGEYTLPGKGGEKRSCDIKCIYRDTAHSPANQFSGGNYVEEAYRKVEFVLVQDFMFSTDARLADIVLPVTSTLEYEISAAPMCPHDFVMVGGKVLEPYYESKPDVEVFFLLADKLGVGEDVVPRMSVKQGEFNKVATAFVATKDGSDYEPLVSITQDDLDKLGVEGTLQEGRVPVLEFLEKGAYQVERAEGDVFMNCFGKAFREDPEANPVATASGKYEIYCQSLKDYYDFIGFSDIDALPKYKPAFDGYEQAKEDGAYPYQLVTIHHIRQAHSVFSNVKQLNEVFANDLLMSEYDAKRAGVSKGDWVKVTSSAASIARRVNTIPNLMPGVVILGQGNWRRTDEETGVDIGGNVNTLTRPLVIGDAYQPFNSVLVAIEPWTGPELKPDYLRESVAPITE